MDSAKQSARRWLVALGTASVVAAVSMAQARSAGSGQAHSTRSGQAPSTNGGSRAVQRSAAAPYYPERFDWLKQTPEQARMDAAKLDAAIKFSVASENPATKDLAIDLATTFGREPFDTPIGPVKPRGALSGIVIRNGYVVAEWGETTRVDMTFSVTKTLPVDRRRSDVAEGIDSRRHRSREGLHAAWRAGGALRGAAQLEDHVGAHAAPDERLAGNHLGEA